MAIKEFLNKKAGISRPIICKNCGKKVGYVTPRMRFKIKLIMWGAVIAFIVQFVTQLMTDYILFKFLNLR